jgi:uncharacterized protein (DUF849 family)
MASDRRLYNLAHFADGRIVTPPFFVQGVFGILGGIGAEPETPMHMKATADRLFGLAALQQAGVPGRDPARGAVQDPKRRPLPRPCRGA